MYLSQRDAFGSTPVAQGDGGSAQARYTDLSVQSRITSLEVLVESLRQKLVEAQSVAEGDRDNADMQENSVRSNALEIARWNRELVTALEEQRRTILKVTLEAKAQVLAMGNEVERLKAKCEELQNENNELKKRVADDVLRERQANRVQMALEKSRIAGRVRTAGLRRLEALEAVLMETHDDLYYVRRFDSTKAPIRNVTFVTHVVANMGESSGAGVDLTINVYNHLLLNLTRKHGGFHVCSSGPFKVSVFYCATSALHFARDCHVDMTKVAWPKQTTAMPHFAPIVENGELLYNGPRIHTCVYTCTPGSSVDPITGDTLYYGEEVRDAFITALESAPVGEIVVNKAWGLMYCKEKNINADVNQKPVSSVQEVREKLGAGWSVVATDPDKSELLCSVLPVSLQARRGLPPYMLHPVPRFVRTAVNSQDVLANAIKSMKVMAPVCPTTVGRLQHGACPGSWAECISMAERREVEGCEVSDPEIVTLHTLQREWSKAVKEYANVESICAHHESLAMEAEDLYVNRFRPFEPGRGLFVCTIDISDVASWRQMTGGKLAADELYDMRDRLISTAISYGKKNDGLHINGNGRDVVTFAFQRPEQALRFAAQVYSSVDQVCECFKKAEMCLMRAGISVGTIYPINRRPDKPSRNNSPNDARRGVDKHNKDDSSGVLWCRGGAVLWSGYICDAARYGEIMVSGGVINALHSKKSAITSGGYNILRQGYKMFGEDSTMTEVFSVLPSGYAYRRIQQRNELERQSLNDGKMRLFRRSAKSELVLGDEFFRREEVLHLLQQGQSFVERAEAAAMAAHDTAWHASAKQALRLSWFVSGMSKLSRERAGELAFLYCKASGLNTISKLVSDDMFTEVCGSYNCVVQETVLANNGFIAKTDSHSAYIIVFNDIYQAVNTARKIQLGLMAVDWPSKILTLEASLRVKSIKTGMLLFNGIRAMTAIHVSRDYSWTRVQNPIDGFEAVDMCGPAIEILMAFARKACSGEILLTDAAQRSIRSTFNGSVFLDQFEVVPVDDSLMDGLAAYSCAPKSVRERLDMLSIQERSRDPPVALRQKHRSVDGRSKSAISSSEKDMWWVDQSSSVTPLPVALQVSLGVARSSAQDDISAATSEAMDHIASRLKYEVASSVDLSTNCECFLNIAREVVSNLRLFFRNWGDKDERSISFKKTSLVEPFSTENCADEHMPLMQDGERSPRAHLRRFPRSVTLTNINTAWCEDKYKAVLNTIEETLKTTAKRNIRGGGGSTAAVPKVIKPATPSLERGVTRPKKRLPPIQ